MADRRTSNPARLCIAAVALGAAGLVSGAATGTWGVASAAAAPAPALTPLIPAYYPATGVSTDPWQAVPPSAQSNRTPAIEVMNADSGPGTNIGVTDPTAAGLAAYQAAITTAHHDGALVYGYVWTNY